jgi:hypothetical protein
VKIIFSILYMELFVNTFIFLIQNKKLNSTLKSVVRSFKKHICTNIYIALDLGNICLCLARAISYMILVTR